jgi:hypothetical protein
MVLIFFLSLKARTMEEIHGEYLLYTSDDTITGG